MGYMATSRLITPSTASRAGQAAMCSRQQLRATRNASVSAAILSVNVGLSDHGGDGDDASCIDAEL